MEFHDIADFVLMHKEHETAKIGIDRETGRIAKVYKIIDRAHFPLYGAIKGKDSEARPILDDWWRDTRTLPISRVGLARVLRPLRASSGSQLLLLNNGLSMVDHYWIKQAGDDFDWADINFYDNGENNKQIGDFMVYDGVDMRGRPIADPSFAVNGAQPKRWLIHDGVVVLEKAPTVDFNNQQAFNEQIGGLTAAILNFHSVQYGVREYYGRFYSFCKSFTDRNTEYISADAIMKTRQKSNNHSEMQHYAACCEHLGIDPDIAMRAFAENAVVDSVIANSDRSKSNFGFKRDADTLEYISPAPMFDFANSLWSDCVVDRGTFIIDPNGPGRGNTFIEMAYDMVQYPCSKPFHSEHGKQLAAIPKKYFAHMDLKHLDAVPDLAHGILKRHMDPQRLDMTIAALRTRIDVTRGLVL